MIELKQYYRYRCVVRIRSDERYRVKPGLETLNGREFVLSPLWCIGADENELYGGEYAMGAPLGAMPADDELRIAAICWIASGDVEVLEEVEPTD